MALTLDPNHDAGTDFGVAGLTRNRGLQRGDQKPGDISYIQPHGKTSTASAIGLAAEGRLPEVALHPFVMHQVTQ